MQLFDENLIPTKTFSEAVLPPENTFVNPRIIGGSLSGVSYTSNINGARLEIFPPYDPTIGLQILNSAGTNTFKAEIAGTNTGDITIGNYAGGQGAKYDSSADTFSLTGAFSAGSISIGTTPNWFRCDTSGNIWSGADTLATAKTTKFAVENTGALYATSATITGALTAGAGSSLPTTYLSGVVGLSNTNISAQGWTNTCVFSATNYRVVAWATGVITTAAGTAYNITGSNTGNMTTTTYIYLDIATSTTLLQITTTATTAIGSGKILIGVAFPNTDTTSKAQYQVFGGTGGQRIFVDNISANSASTNEFISNSAQLANLVVTNAKINDLAVDKLTAGSITSKAITLAVEDGTGDSKIQAGKTDFGDTTSGFILGIDDSDDNKPKFEFGDADNYIIYNGTALIGNNFKLINTFEAGENITSGNIVCIKPSYTDYVAQYDTYVDEYDPDTSYGNEEYVEVVSRTVGDRYAYFKWDTTTWPSECNILKAELILTVRGYTGGGSKNADLYRVTSSWDETMTWNTPYSGVEAVAYLAKFIGCEYRETYGAVITGNTMTWDITYLARQWKSGNLTNYGLVVLTDEALDTILNFYSSENTTSDTYKPKIRIYGYNQTDAKIYKAKNDDYLFCRSIVGVATETITSGNSGKIQIGGIVENITTDSTGGKIYLSSTSGGKIEALTGTGTNRVISLGDIINSNKVLWNPSKQDILIEKVYTTSTTPVLYVDGVGAYTFRAYAPNDARYCVVGVYGNSGGGNLGYCVLKVYRDQLGLENMTIGDVGDVLKYVTVDWNVNGYVNVSSAGGGAGSNFYVSFFGFYT